jgi:integrase
MKSNRLPIKSVIDSSAQTTKQCAEASDLSFLEIEVENILKSINNLPIQLHELALIMFYSGLRVSEALQIRYSDIDALSRVKIKGAKGSLNRVVDCSIIKEYLLTCKADRRNPFDGLSRFYVYRQFKNNGLSRFWSNNSKLSVTHTLRILSIKLMESGINDLSMVQGYIGHKKINSTKYYVEKK